MREFATPELGKGVRSTWARWRTAGFVLLAATLLGWFFSAQIYLSAASSGRPVSWWQAVYWAFGDWYEWALLSPAIFWLCRRHRLDSSSWAKSLPVYLIGGLVLATVHALMCAGAEVLQGWLAGPPVALTAAWRRLMANRFHFNLAVYAVVVFAWHAWNYRRTLREQEAQAAELASRLAQTQLRMLRMQLNPHFLCNTLNAISSLMLTDVTTANRMLSRLGDLLRLALDNSHRQETSLRQEMDFLRRYLEIEQIRFGARLEVRWEVDPATLDALVPSLILQPLVENAIRHAVEPRVAPGRVELHSKRDRDRLVLQVVDDGPGMSATADVLPPAEDRRERIGLKNTQERLRMLYGDGQLLALAGNGAGGVTASLSIPYRLAAAAL